MNKIDAEPCVLPFCPHCKELSVTGVADPGRMEVAGGYAHFFCFGDLPYLMRFTRCATCRRPYVHFLPYNGYLPGRGLYYPFPVVYPNK
jgi:hypothetical protein